VSTTTAAAPPAIMGAEGPPDASVSDATGLLPGAVLSSAGDAFCAVADAGAFAELLATVGDLTADDDGLADLPFEAAFPADEAEEGVEAVVPPGNTTSEHE
jgi:hypothetical protein